MSHTNAAAANVARRTMAAAHQPMYALRSDGARSIGDMGDGRSSVRPFISVRYQPSDPV